VEFKSIKVSSLMDIQPVAARTLSKKAFMSAEVSASGCRAALRIMKEKGAL